MATASWKHNHWVQEEPKIALQVKHFSTAFTGCFLCEILFLSYVSLQGIYEKGLGQLYSRKDLKSLSWWYIYQGQMVLPYSHNLNFKCQETCFSSVSSFVIGRKTSLENVQHMIKTQNYWKECINKIPLEAFFLLLCWWLDIGIRGRVNYMSMVCFSKDHLSLHNLSPPVLK